MRRAYALPSVKIISTVLMLAWPFVIWFGLEVNGLRWLLPLMMVLLLTRIAMTPRHSGPMRSVMLVAALAGLTLCLLSYLFNRHEWLLFYPVAVNCVMLLVFGGSLWTTMPLVERLARLREPDLPPAAVCYTRRVTQVWCLFFIVNGSAALWTALHGDLRLWTLWNGALSYTLMGLLMTVEWVVRCQVRKREQQ
ncbi:hypothetical protein [Siccibacter turicensis]|uniref:COG4648 family protein n=1 Tax=Siccibacter turicensis TaxID=357233 RepID=UPI0023F501F7|nr:hypothetical protein [Siccibacter turicensis]